MYLQLQVKHEINCYHNNEVGEVRKSQKDKYWRGFRHSRKGKRDGGE